MHIVFAGKKCAVIFCFLGACKAFHTQITPANCQCSCLPVPWKAVTSVQQAQWTTRAPTSTLAVHWELQVVSCSPSEWMTWPCGQSSTRPSSFQIVTAGAGRRSPVPLSQRRGVSAQKSGSMLMFHLKGFNQAAESFANILQMFTAPKIIYLIAHLFIN